MEARDAEGARVCCECQAKRDATLPGDLADPLTRRSADMGLSLQSARQSPSIRRR
jgi:hypothetical protein